MVNRGQLASVPVGQFASAFVFDPAASARDGTCRSLRDGKAKRAKATATAKATAKAKAKATATAKDAKDDKRGSVQRRAKR